MRKAGASEEPFNFGVAKAWGLEDGGQVFEGKTKGDVFLLSARC
jgi:hypothetical protein